MPHPDESHRLIEVSHRYTDQGLTLPRHLAPRLARLVRPCTLADLDRHGTAEGLVGAWTATRENRRSESDDTAWLVLLRMFYSRFNESVPELKEVLRARRMSLTKTRVEIRLQLASKCFFLGRRLVHRDKGSRPGRFLLEECVEVSREVLPVEDALHRPGRGPDRRSTLRGQLANALTIMSRTAPPEAAVALLVEAEEHAAAAERFGDRTEEHFAYRIETGLRLFTSTQDRAHLERACDLVVAVGDTRSKRLRATAADTVAQLGFLHVGPGDRDEAITLLTDSESRYGQALAAAPDREDGGVDDGYLLAKRAQVRNRLYRLGDDHGRRSSPLLDDALADWLDERAERHRHDPSVVGALLDRARVRARRNDNTGARADRERARGLLTSAASIAVEAKLRAAELEELVEEASAADDLERLQALVAEITQLPSDAPVPTAALVRAGKILALTMPEERWRPLLSAALDRIEVDLVHPSLTGPATRHVAGHAALLAWLLGRRTHDADLLGRAVQLFRTSFDASGAEPPSVDALMNAGACALQLGKNVQAGTEQAAEEAASLFAEGLTWLQAGLARSRSGTAVREDFDPVLPHSRLGELALRLYPLTWDANHLDTAIEQLATARELGEQALQTDAKGLQLTGLLGDAHYRRGVAQNEPEDLHRAIALKDAVYETGAEQRENRSLTAAAALRLARLTADDRLLADAVRRALQAARCDPAWPWPVLQLGDLAGYAARLDDPGLAATEPRDLAGLVVAGRRPELLRRAAELAVHSVEFQGSILGGQPRPGEHGVRVLNDQHRLIEQAIVLKRLGHEDAHREHGDTVRFRDWLAGAGAPESWTLPEPLTVVDLAGGDSVYVMRRAQSRLLGASVVDWRTGPGPDPRPRFREALRYLAAFQAWRALSDDRFPRVCGPDGQAAFRSQLAKVARNLGAEDELLRLLSAACEPFAAEGTPAVAKKDPHPGNWLWTRDGRLVLIDIESTDALPLLREAATVIDDLPLLDADDEGWHRRAALCGDYLDALAEFGLRIDDRDHLMARYEAMVALHTAKGLGGYAGRARGSPPSPWRPRSWRVVTTARCCSTSAEPRSGRRPGTWLPAC